MNPAIAGLPAGRPLGVTLPPSTGPLRFNVQFGSSFKVKDRTGHRTTDGPKCFQK